MSIWNSQTPSVSIYSPQDRIREINNLELFGYVFASSCDRDENTMQRTGDEEEVNSVVNVPDSQESKVLLISGFIE